ncbi:MAG: M14 family zinc carboxypeptidase [Myxococcota bacterium]
MPVPPPPPPTPAAWVADPPAPLGEAWIRANAIASGIAGVGPGEGRRVDGDGVWRRVVVEPWALDALRAATEVRGYVAAPALRRAAGYHGADDVQAVLEALGDAAVRGGRLRAGTSLAGRPIDALWLGQPPDSGAPAVRLLGGHHGDEAISVEVALAVTERLVAGDGVEPAITALLDRATVWCVPDVNPDGLEAGTRENARGVDLNRNYDYEWSAGSVRPGARPFSEPETRAVRGLMGFDHPAVSLTVHAGAANLGWPWNFTVDDPPDAALLGLLADDYAASCTAPGFWLTQGGDWYVTRGDTNDWAYGRHGSLDLTLEVAVERAPADVDAVVAWHEQAILGLLTAPPALQGVVVDAETGAPVEARVAGDGARPVLASAVTGAFQLPGPAETLTVTAPGYAAAEVPGDGPLQVALAPTTLAAGRLAPTALLGQAPVAPVGEAFEGDVQLVLPGYDPVTVPSAGGALSLGLEAPAPRRRWRRARGRWVWPDGRGEPGASVASPEDVVVEELTADGVLRASPLAPGVRAWALGRRSAVVPVPVLAEGADEATLDLGVVPDDPAPVDLLVQSGSALLALADVRYTAHGAAGRAREQLRLLGTAGPAGGRRGGRWSLLGVRLRRADGGGGDRDDAGAVARRADAAWTSATRPPRAPRSRLRPEDRRGPRAEARVPARVRGLRLEPVPRLRLVHRRAPALLPARHDPPRDGRREPRQGHQGRAAAHAHRHRHLDLGQPGGAARRPRERRARRLAAAGSSSSTPPPTPCSGSTCPGCTTRTDLARTAKPTGVVFSAIEDDDASGARKVFEADLTTGQIVEPFPWLGPVDTFTYTAAGNGVVATTDQTVTLYDAETGKKRGLGRRPSAGCCTRRALADAETRASP